MTAMTPSTSLRSRLPSSRHAVVGDRTTLRFRTLATLVVLALGCAEPALTESNEGEGTARPIEVQTPDPGRDTLLAELDALRSTVGAARDELAGALGSGDPAEARRAGGRAVTRLIAAPELDADAGTTPPVFPSTTTERGSIEGDDLLTASSTAARDAGGALGRAVLELLRDPLAGDLGAWQHDPAGVVASVRAATGASGELETLEQAVFELPGEGTRALAWALLTADPPRPADTLAYAERGVTHLEVVLTAIDDLLTEVDDEDPEAEGADDGDADEGSSPGDDEDEA
jgi:hypothetical protein